MQVPTYQWLGMRIGNGQFLKRVRYHFFEFQSWDARFKASSSSSSNAVFAVCKFARSS